MYINIHLGLFIRLNRNACLIDQISILMNGILSSLSSSTDCDILVGQDEGYCYELFERIKYGL